MIVSLLFSHLGRRSLHGIVNLSTLISFDSFMFLNTCGECEIYIADTDS